MSLLKFKMSSQKAGITGIPRVAEWMKLTCVSSCNGMWTHLGAPIPPVEKFCPLGEKPQGSGCSRCVPDLQEIFPSRSSS